MAEVAEAAHSFVPIGPMDIRAVSMHQLVEDLVRSASASPKTQHVVTANAQFYTLAEQREDFRECLAQAEYVCADGVSLVLACKLLGSQKVDRVAGVDLVERVCARSVEAGLSVYFCGGREGSAEAAAAVLAERYPGFRLAGSSCPPHGFEGDQQALSAVLADIRRVKPSIIFVALGAPRQEFFISRYIRPLGVSVAVGVGGSFEIIAGLVRRAPLWVQDAGFEWAYRLMQEPRRLAHRYIVGNTKFFLYLLKYALLKATRGSLPSVRDLRAAKLRQASHRNEKDPTQILLGADK